LHYFAAYRTRSFDKTADTPKFHALNRGFIAENRPGTCLAKAPEMLRLQKSLLRLGAQ